VAAKSKAAQIKALARRHTQAAIKVLAAIMNTADGPATARVSAAQALLDRGWGKAAQPVAGGGWVEPIPTMSLDQLMNPPQLGAGGAEIDAMARGEPPSIQTSIPTGDYDVGPVNMPQYHFYPDRLETDYALLGEPRVRAMLALIRDREGPAYNVIYGGKTFDDYSRHPNIGVGGSHAAGAYQIQPGTWEPIRKALNLPDFSPSSQDLAAVDLLRQKGVTGRLLSNDPEDAILKAGAGTWESLPASAAQKPNAAGSMRGMSWKGHEVDTLDQVLADYWSRLR